MATYYIATTGNDSTGAGTSGNPWLTLSKAYTSSTSGDTISIAAGTYTFATASMSTGRTLTPSGAVVFDAASVSDVHWKIGGDWTIGTTSTANTITFKNGNLSNTAIYCFIGYTNVSGAAGTCTFNNCIFRDTYVRSNSGSYGGLIGNFAAASSTFNLNNCLIYNIYPQAGGTAGKIFTRDNLTFNLKNTIISFTSLTDNFTVCKEDSSTKINYTNSIVYNGTAKTVNSVSSAICTATYSCFYAITGSPTGTGVITSDPLLVSPSGANFELQVSSPCLDTGIIV